MDERIILHGGGEHARVVLDCLSENAANVVGIFDPAYTGELMGVPQRGKYRPDVEPGAKIIIAIGDNRLRRTVVEKTVHEFSSAIHPSAVVSKFARLGVGNMILHRTVVQAQSVIGNHIIINTGAQVDHDCIIGDFVHLAPGVVLCGTVHVGEGALIGAGAIVLPGIRIGAWAKVGAGAVVRKDIPDFAVAVGNPARIIRRAKHA